MNAMNEKPQTNFKPLMEGLKEVKTIMEGREASDKDEGRSWKHNPRQTTEPVAIGWLIEIYGTGQVAKDIGISPEALRRAIRDNEVTKHYELAAKWLKSQAQTSHQQEKLSLDELLVGLLRHFQGMSPFDLTPEMAEVLNRPLGETLKAMRNAAGAGATPAKAAGR